MQNIWSNEVMTFEPEPFAKINETTRIQRVNIVKNEDGTWSCKSRFISEEDYRQLLSDMSSPAQLELVSKLEEAQAQNIATMEAIADLYEMLLSLNIGG